MAAPAKEYRVSGHYEDVSGLEGLVLDPVQGMVHVNPDSSRTVIPHGAPIQLGGGFVPMAGFGPSVGLNIQGAATGNGNAVASRMFYFLISSDNINQGNPPGTGTKVEGLALEHHYGGPAMKGGRNSLVAYSILDSPSSATNPDRNYVGIQAVFGANSGDGGVLPGSPQGAGFALSTLAHVVGGTGWLNLTAGDFELVVDGASSCQIQAGIQVGGSVGSNGTVVDAVVYLTCGTGFGFAPIGYTTGFWIGSETGAPALAATGTVMKVRGHLTLANAFDFTATTFTGYLLSSNGFSISAPAGNHNIQLGRQDAVASSPFFDFHSHGTPAAPDARLIASGGDGTSFHGTLDAILGTLQVSGQLTSAIPLQVLAIAGQTAAIQVWYVNAAPLLSVTSTGALQTSAGNESTGAGSAVLGANSPATVLTAPYKWLKFFTSDATPVFVPAWK